MIMIGAVRAGAILIFLFQTALYLFLDLNLPRGLSLADHPAAS